MVHQRLIVLVLLILFVCLGTNRAHAQELFADQVIARVCLEPNAEQYRIDLNGPNHAFEKYLKCGRYSRALDLISKNPNRFKDEKLCSKTLATLFLLRKFSDVISFGEHYLQNNRKCSNEQLKLVNDYIGSAYSLQGDMKNADICFKKAQIITDGSAENTSIGKNLQLMIEMTTGMPVVEMISAGVPLTTVKSHPSKIHDSAALAKSAEDLGDYAKAIALYSKALKQGAPNAELYGALAVCQMSEAILSSANNDTKLRSARKYLESARRLDSKNWRFQNNLAICCYLIPDSAATNSELNKLRSYRGLPSEQLDGVKSLIQTCKIMRTIDSD